MTSVIECTDVTRRYGSGRSQSTAVDGVSLTVKSGELFGLLGTNGAGKTSLLEVIEGLSTPYSGFVEVMGHNPVRERTSLRPRIGIMLQSGGLPRELTVAETLAMWHGTCTKPAPIEDVLQQVDLTHRREVRVGALSGGEQRRLDLACALLGQPELVFLDEPTTGLDPESRRNTWDLLGKLRSRGVTMILTTHYLDEAEHLCDRIALMHKGRIRTSGTVREIVDSYPEVISFEYRADMGDLPNRLRTRSQINVGAAVCTIRTRCLQEDLYVLLGWAADNRLELRSLDIRRASLESAYFALIDESKWKAGTRT